MPDIIGVQEQLLVPGLTLQKSSGRPPWLSHRRGCGLDGFPQDEGNGVEGIKGKVKTPQKRGCCSEVEARGGLEPPNRGFADLSLSLLGTAP